MLTLSHFGSKISIIWLRDMDLLEKIQNVPEYTYGDFSKEDELTLVAVANAICEGDRYKHKLLEAYVNAFMRNEGYRVSFDNAGEDA